jgi:tetratricopeptide (TPR) repeat protein
MMGIALEKVEELENACDAYERACELEDDHGPTWANVGTMLLLQKRSDEALNAGRRVIELMPDHPDGYGIAGRALMQQKNFDEALPLLEKCDEVRPKYRNGRAHRSDGLPNANGSCNSRRAPPDAPKK